ncbi:MAG: hypothetical protein V4677_14165 [Bacteroidota bacterium]
MENIKKHENLHIVFWLIKDSCWMLKLKLLGIIMVIPTVFIAVLIVYVSRKTMDIYLNLAVLCWICANSYWMCIEFYTDESYKHLAAIPFGLGFIFVGIYYGKILAKKLRTSR